MKNTNDIKYNTKAIFVPTDKRLMPFQMEAVEKMLTFLNENESNSCYNAHEPGLGKTIQTIVTINSLDFNNNIPTGLKVLIICPTVMLYTWEKEIQTWSTLFNYSIFICNKGSKILDCGAAIYTIVPYGIAGQEGAAKFLAKQNFDVLVLDEAHYLKSSKAQRTKNILKTIWPKVKHRIALSGTPITNSVVDGWTIFSRMAPSKFPDWFAFANRYANAKRTPWGIHYEGIKNAEELSKTIRFHFFLRKTKEEVLPELPQIRFSTITLGQEYAVKMAKSEKDRAEDELVPVLAAIENNQTFKIPTTLQGLRRAQGLVKLKAVAEFMESFVETGTPLVVFGYHREFIQLLSERFKAANPSVITGETESEDRFKAVANFQDGITNLFIGSISAASTGITLTRASNVILAELSWSPSEVEQAYSRCHRITQKDAVNVYTLTVKGSIDERITNVLLKKMKVIDLVINN